MTKMSAEKVIIAGAGMGGLTLAAALEKKNIPYIVYERGEGLAEGGGFKLWPNAMRALDQIGLASELLPLGSKIEIGWVRSCRGQVLSRVPLHKVSSKSGFPILSLPRTSIGAALYRAVPKEKIRFGHEVIDVRDEDSQVSIEFKNGELVRGALLVGCDGANSRVRNLVFPDRQLHYEGRISWRGIAHHDTKPCRENESWELYGPGMRFGYAYMGPGVVGWYAPINSREDFRPQDPKQYLLETFATWPSEVKQLIESTNRDGIIRSPIRFREFDEKWGRGLVTLLGDAAHVMTPDLAQGACQALEDAVVLADVLSARGVNENALRVYEQRRITRVRSIAERSMQVGRMSQWDGPIKRWLRDQMWRYMPESVALSQLEKAVDFDFMRNDSGSPQR